MRVTGEPGCKTSASDPTQMKRHGINWPRDLDPNGENNALQRRVGCTYLHLAVDGFSRLAFNEALEGEAAKTMTGFFARARAYFAAHGLTRVIRVVKDREAVRELIMSITGRSAPILRSVSVGVLRSVGKP